MIIMLVNVMYENDGDFGRVRLTMRSLTDNYKTYFNCITICGWHCCNHKYCINRLAKDSPTNLILYTVSGKGKLVMNGVTYTLLPSTAILIKSDVTVSYYTPKNEWWEFYWIHFIGNPCQPLIDLISRQKEQLVAFRSDSIRTLTEYALNDKNGDNIQSVIHVSGMLSNILHEIVANQDIENVERNEQEIITNKVTSYIQNHYSEEIGIQELSKTIYISCEHLIRVFKKETRITPYTYLCRFRIQKAKDLLTYTGISIAEISHMVGFHNHSNFSRQFKAVSGMTPAKFRKNH